MDDPLSQDVIDRINEALYAGQKIEAIKIYRTATSSGLLDAKTFVEALEVQLREQSPEKFTFATGQSVQVGPLGCLIMIILLATAIVVVAWALGVFQQPAR